MPFTGSTANVAPRRSGPRAFDPLRAHGAWVFLFASVAAGALVGTGYAVERAMLVGTGVAGGFLLFSAVYVGLRYKSKKRQAVVGAGLPVVMLTAAMVVDPSPNFLIPGSLGLLLATAALLAGRHWGFLSRSTVTLGTAAIVTTAPTTALAAGAEPLPATLLFGMMLMFCCRQTLRVLSDLGNGHEWNKVQLRRRGLREAALTAGWTIFAIAIVRNCA